MNNLDLVSELEKKNASDILLQKLLVNKDNILYKDFLIKLEEFVTESKSKKNKDFNYFINSDGNFEKKHDDETNTSQNYILKKNIFLNINNKIKELNEELKTLEFRLRINRDELVDGKSEIRVDFEKIKEQYYNLVSEKESYLKYLLEVNKVNENKQNVLEKN